MGTEQCENSEDRVFSSPVIAPAELELNWNPEGNKNKNKNSEQTNNKQTVHGFLYADDMTFLEHIQKSGSQSTLSTDTNTCIFQQIQHTVSDQPGSVDVASLSLSLSLSLSTGVAKAENK